MFPKQTIKDVNVKDKTILVRTDYNVPIKDATITDDLRLRASLPTLKYLLDHGAQRLVLISHLGRPKGQKNPEFSLRLVATRLSELLGQTVNFVDEVSGPDVEAAVDQLPKGGILLLENLRFSPGEEQNSTDFAREIIESTHADLFVQDGFAVIHRAHASTAALAAELPAVAGLLVEKEVSTLNKAIENPTRPLLVIIGGAKVADKEPLINHFLPLADHIAIGGKIAADGYEASNPKIYVATDFRTDSDGVKLDIGPDSTAKIIDLINQSQTVIWNGVLGQTENPEFAQSSTAVAETISNNPHLTSIICGGDTTGFVENLQSTNSSLHYDLISTGGGASLELLSGLPLPGLDALGSK